jgi:hypothetical protein
MAEPVYTYLATDLKSNRALGELHPTGDGLTFDVQFNQPGNFSCNIGLDDSAVSNEFIIGATHPAKTAIWAYRDNKIVWGGILWTRVYQASSRQLQLTAQTFDTYAARRYPRSWLVNDTRHYNENQCRIINNLWTQMQGVKHGNIQVHPQREDDFPRNDVQRKIDVRGTDMSQTVADVIQTILDFNTGPDYVIEWEEDGFGMPKKRLRVGNNIGRYVTTINIGGETGQPSLVADYPEGSILDYTYTENGGSGANKWYVVGGQKLAPATKTHQKKMTTVIGSAQNLKILDAGWPLLEMTSSRSKIKVNEALNDIAENKLKHHPTPEIVHATDLAGFDLPEFGTYKLGDHWAVHIVDPRFPNGVTYTKRVIGWSVTPTDTGGVETVSLVFDEPTS